MSYSWFYFSRPLGFILPDELYNQLINLPVETLIGIISNLYISLERTDMLMVTTNLYIYIYIFFLIATLFIYLFIFSCVGSSFRARAFSSCGKWGPLFIVVRGPLFIAVRGPLTIAAPPVAGHRLQTRRLSSCGSRAQLLCGMWDLPRPGLEPVSPALAGRLSTTAPPGKPPMMCII